MAEGHSSKVVVFSLVANLAIAVVKGIAAVFTRSGSMMAETIHSVSDCLNQVLLLIGLRGAAKGPTPRHPLGTGRASYFWSFLVALMLFFGGGVFSIGEGIEKIIHPEAVDHVWMGIGILGFALALEGVALVKCMRAINAKRGDVPLRKFLKTTKDAELVVVTGENFADVAGLTLAFAALPLALWVHPVFDGIGSVAVGCVLVYVAIFLARKIKSLLLGEAAGPWIEAAVRDSAKEDTRILEVLRLITVQQGPGEVMLAAKLRIDEKANATETAIAINEFEERVKKREPEVRWLFIEPDIRD